MALVLLGRLGAKPQTNDDINQADKYRSTGPCMFLMLRTTPPMALRCAELWCSLTCRIRLCVRDMRSDVPFLRPTAFPPPSPPPMSLGFVRGFLGTCAECQGVKIMFTDVRTMALAAATPYIPQPPGPASQSASPRFSTPPKHLIIAGRRTCFVAMRILNRGSTPTLTAKWRVIRDISGASDTNSGPSQTNSNELEKPQIMPIGNAMVKPSNITACCEYF